MSHTLNESRFKSGMLLLFPAHFSIVIVFLALGAHSWDFIDFDPDFPILKTNGHHMWIRIVLRSVTSSCQVDLRTYTNAAILTMSNILW